MKNKSPQRVQRRLILELAMLWGTQIGAWRVSEASTMPPGGASAAARLPTRALVTRGEAKAKLATHQSAEVMAPSAGSVLRLPEAAAFGFIEPSHTAARLAFHPPVKLTPRAIKATASPPDSSASEITLDGTLGSPGQISPIGDTFQITSALGRILGPNLFESFSRFNVTAGQTVSFSGPASIRNVLIRVTGGTPTSVDGGLQCTIPGASLYLINPAGLVFGPDCKLDLLGSFGTSTADSLSLAGGGTFRAALNRTSTLSAAEPTGFTFRGHRPSAIEIMGSTGLSQTAAAPLGGITIVGGDINLNASQIITSGGQINLVSVGSGATASIGSGGLQSPIEAPVGRGRAIDMVAQSALETLTGGIWLTAGSILLDHSNVLATGEAVGRSVQLRASGHLSVVESTIGSTAPLVIDAGVADLQGFTTNVFSDNSGGSAPIEVGVRALRLGQFANLDAQGSGGAASDITIRASESVFLGAIQAIPRISQQTGGSIDISAPLLKLGLNGEIEARSPASNGATIVARVGRLVVDDPGALLSADAFTPSDANAPPPGRGGEIDIQARSALIGAGGEISATSNFGEGGNIKILAKNVTVAHPGVVGLGGFSGIFTDGGGGAGGNIIINSDRVAIRNFTRISASSLGGAGGSIQIDSGRFSVERAEVDASGFSGGEISIRARKLFSLSGGALGVQGTDRPPEVGGVLSIHAGAVHLDNGALLSERAQQNGGDIIIDTKGGVSLFSSQVQTTTGPLGGSIKITSNGLALSDSAIDAFASSSAGGNVVLNSPLLLEQDSTIHASGTFKSSTPPTSNLLSQLVPLPSPLAHESDKLQPQCGIRFYPGQTSSFVIVGPGGAPPEPSGWLPSETPAVGDSFGALTEDRS